MFIRLFQGIMKIGMYFIPWGMPKLIEGEGCLNQLPNIISQNGHRKALIVVSGFMYRNGHINSLLEEMDRLGIAYTIYSGVSPNPLDIEVEHGVKVYLENNCEAIIALGGGSPMDCAKAIGARVARPNKSISQLQGLYKVLKKTPMLYAVPTTSGTGSETTVAAVITESKTHHKASINDSNLMPAYAILDPTLTISVPTRVTAFTGMDALSHAVEAYTNHMYNTKLENNMAKEAVRLIYHNLYNAYCDGSNLEARMQMQKASFYAGRAFTRGCVGNVHAIGHTLSGIYGVSHGEAMGILLPLVMRAYGDKVHLRLSELADVCGLAQGKSVAEKAERFIVWMEELKHKMGIVDVPNCICETDVEQMVNWAYAEAVPLYPTPVIWSKEDYRKFINSLIQ